MTIRDIFGSLHDNVVSKIKNPFWGTFSIVFVIKNWPLFYSLLFFDSSETRLTRIQYIEQYIGTHNGALCIFGLSLLFTLLVLVLSYTFAQVGIFISHFAEAKVTPRVVSLATKGAKIVTKEQYDKLEKVYQQTSEKLQEEKRKRAAIDAENDELQKKIIELEKKDVPSDSILVSLEKVNNIISKNQEKEIGMSENKEAKIVNKIINNPDWISQFSKIIATLTSGHALSFGDPNTDSFMNYLLLHNVLNNNGHGYAKLTEFGEKVRNLFSSKMI